MYYFVQLSTHHHLQSAQPLPPFERHYLFSSRPFSLPSFSAISLALPLIHSGLCCWAVMYWSSYLFAFFSQLILCYCPSWRPVASGTRPPREFCSLCPRHESASQDNDEELRHTGDTPSINDHTSKVFLTYTAHTMSLLQSVSSLCEELRSPFVVVF